MDERARLVDYAQRLLPHAISECSDAIWGEPWRRGCEHIIWEALTGGAAASVIDAMKVAAADGKKKPIELDKRASEDLRQLSRDAGGWVVVDEDDQRWFIEEKEWSRRHFEWRERALFGHPR